MSLPAERAVAAIARAAIAVHVAALLLSTAIGPRPAFADEDPRDRLYVMEQVNQALETQRTEVEVPWLNPETGNGGIIVVERTFYRDTGEPCRDYRRTQERSGAPPLVFHGTGCRVAPARWEIDEKEPLPAKTPKTGTDETPGTGRAPDPGTKSASPPPAVTGKTAPEAATPDSKSAAADTPASCPDPVAPAPPITVVKAPCGKPSAFTTYTLPSKAKL